MENYMENSRETDEMGARAGCRIYDFLNFRSDARSDVWLSGLSKIDHIRRHKDRVFKRKRK